MMKRCPFCAEEILAEAIRCKHCRSDLPPVQHAVPTQAEEQDPSPPRPTIRAAIAWGAIAIGLLIVCVAAFFVDQRPRAPSYGGEVAQAAVPVAAPAPAPAPEPSPPVRANDDLIGAWVAAQYFVKQRLKSPGSASFGSVWKGEYQDPSTHVWRMSDGAFRAHGWVDSQNGFGALIRTQFNVIVSRNTANDGWDLVTGPTFLDDSQ